MKFLKKWNESPSANRLALRFFALMLILTLIARGTSGAVMARVKLAKPGRGIIVQEMSATAVLIAEDGDKLMIPEGIPVDKLWVTEGQTVKEGEKLFLLNTEKLQKQLDQCLIQNQKQKVQLEQLSEQAPVDNQGVVSAQKSLDQITEDTAREQRRLQEEVGQAEQQQQATRQKYEQASADWETLKNQIDPLPDEAQLAEMQQAVEQASQELSAAEQVLKQARQALEDAQHSGARQLESARDALTAANMAQQQAQHQAALDQKSNKADAAALKLEMDENDRVIQRLRELLETDGLVTAPRDTQILHCALQQGTPAPAQEAITLAKEDSSLLLYFDVPQDTAEKIKIGQMVQVSQKQQFAEAAVQTIETTETEGIRRITSVIAQEQAAELKTDLPVDLRMEFSRREYSCCVPISAIRQDSSGDFVLGVEQEKTAFGVTNTAVRIPVTVLEVDSSGERAAVQGEVPETVIESTDRAIKDGASVRIES